MKLTRTIFYVIVASLLSFSCESDPIKEEDMPHLGPKPEEPQKPDKEDTETEEHDFMEQVNIDGTITSDPKEGVAKVKTLQTTGYFKETKIMEGIIHYEFFGKDDVSGAHQNVNVLEVDLNICYSLSFSFTRCVLFCQIELFLKARCQRIGGCDTEFIHS